LEALEERRDEEAIEWALWQMEEEAIQATSHHLRGSKPLHHRLGYIPPLGTLEPEYDQILWKLQHQDGLTNRIDFTRSLFVALFFACEPNGLDGSVTALTIPPHYTYPTRNPTRRDLDDPRYRRGVAYDVRRDFRQDLDDPRYSSQHAVLVTAWGGTIPRGSATLTCRVPAAQKPMIQNHLERFHAISGETLFPDMRGAIDAQRTRMQQLTQRELLDLTTIPSL